MLATRALLSKQTLAVLSRQPACFVHQGDYGNWGNTNIAVVSDADQSGRKEQIHGCGCSCDLVSPCVSGFLRMWMVGRY